jgi:hypothetical protein
MPEIYRTPSIEIEPEDRGVVVVHCVDPRYQPHFQDFMHNHLQLEHYALLAVPGGAHCLTLAEYLPKFSWATWRWMKFTVDLMNCHRLILIGHEDCRWYLVQGFVHDEKQLRERVVRDMLRVRAAMQERFPKMRVETFFARLEGTRASFDSV